MIFATYFHHDREGIVPLYCGVLFHNNKYSSTAEVLATFLTSLSIHPSNPLNPLFLSQDYAMKYWRDNGTPVEKLNMGFATYGRTFRLTSSDTSVGAPVSGPASAGPYTREAGFWAYYEVRAWLLGAKTFNTKMLSKVRNPFFIVIPRMLYNGDLCMCFSQNKLPFCVFCSDLHLHKWRNS
jgi:hypothetical protein